MKQKLCIFLLTTSLLYSQSLITHSFNIAKSSLNNNALNGLSISKIYLNKNKTFSENIFYMLSDNQKSHLILIEKKKGLFMKNFKKIYPFLNSGLNMSHLTNSKRKINIGVSLGVGVLYTLNSNIYIHTSLVKSFTTNQQIYNEGFFSFGLNFSNNKKNKKKIILLKKEEKNYE